MNAPSTPVDYKGEMVLMTSVTSTILNPLEFKVSGEAAAISVPMLADLGLEEEFVQRVLIQAQMHFRG